MKVTANFLYLSGSSFLFGGSAHALVHLLKMER
uniref:Uncharacterized protein n=1 Tax=Arundo donax TaxID=35708 RepID=A0A0A8ZUY1_ARUDO